MLDKQGRKRGPGIAKVQCVCDLSGREGSKSRRRWQGAGRGQSNRKQHRADAPGGVLPSSSLWVIALLLFTCCCHLHWRKTFSSKICSVPVTCLYRKGSLAAEAQATLIKQSLFFFFLTFSVAESSDQEKFLEFLMVQIHGWLSTLLAWNLNSGELRSWWKMVKESWTDSNLPWNVSVASANTQEGDRHWCEMLNHGISEPEGALELQRDPWFYRQETEGFKFKLQRTLEYQSVSETLHFIFLN